MLADGVVLIADERDTLDSWSVDALEGCREVGCILLSRTDEGVAADREVVHLENLEEEDLRDLFAGPDRLFHLREDGARELWLRTSGHPARAMNEVAAWIRADLARWAAPKLAVDRQAATVCVACGDRLQEVDPRLDLGTRSRRREMPRVDVLDPR